MNIPDTGRGHDHLHIRHQPKILDKGVHRTYWKIVRYDEGVFERHVRPLSIRISETLVMAEYWKRRGNIQAEIRYRTLAEALIREAEEEWAYDISRFEGNILLNEGITELLNLATGTGTPTAWDATNAYLGVGDGTTAESATQTGLVGTNILYKAMNAGYPTVSAQTATWKADFAGTEANFSWQEFTVSNSSTGNTGVNLNRKVSNQGTKTSGQVWTLQLDISLS